MDTYRRRRVLLTAVALTIRHLIQIITSAANICEDGFDTFIITQNIRRSRHRVPRINNYVSEVIPNLNPRQFQEHFRMLPSTLNYVENVIGRQLTNNSGVGRYQISPRKQLLATIWLLATPDSYRSVGDRFGMSKSCLYYCALRVVKALCEMSSEVIKWPSQNEIVLMKHNHQRRYGFPDVVGAVDGCYIFINKPRHHGTSYNTRKCRYAIVLQAISDPKLRFIDCFAGYPGSVGDYRIFKNSHIYRDVTLNKGQFFPNNEHLLGDKAYPLFDWCITPYRNNGRLTSNQTRFNYVHARARVIIERAFGLLKGRFRRLKSMEVNRTDLAPFYILAACVLHNICLNEGGEDIDLYIDGCTSMNTHDDQQELGTPETEEGASKRNYLCALINR